MWHTPICVTVGTIRPLNGCEGIYCTQDCSQAARAHNNTKDYIKKCDWDNTEMLRGSLLNKEEHNIKQMMKYNYKNITW